MANELCTPPDVDIDPNAIVILRVWVADGVLQLSVDVSVYDSVEDYGTMLAALGNHFVNAMTLDGETTRNEVLSVILRQIARKYKDLENGNGDD